VTYKSTGRDIGLRFVTDSHDPH